MSTDLRRPPAENGPDQFFALERAAPVENAPFEVAQRLHRIFRGRYVLAFVLGTLGAVGGATIGYFTQSPLYQSVGLIRVQPNLEPILYKDAPEVQLNPYFASYVKSQANLLLTPRVITAAMTSDAWRALGRGLEPRDREQFEKYLSATTEREDQEWIRVRFADPDPQAAKIAVSEIIRAYEDSYGESEMLNTPHVQSTLGTRRREAQHKIDRDLDKIREIARDYGGVDLTEILQNRTGEIDRLESENWLVALALQEARAALELQPQGGEGGAATEATIQQIAAVDPEMRFLLDQRLQTAANHARLAASGLGERHYQRVKARSVQEDAERRVREYAEAWLAQQANTGAAGGVPAIGVAQLEARHESLTQRIAALRAEVLDVYNKQTEIDTLQAEIKKNQEQLAQVELRIDQITTERRDLPGVTGRINIISRGEVAHSPKFDNRRKFAALGLIVGGGLPLGLIALIGLMDRRFRYSDEARDPRTNMTLLGILPFLPRNLRDPEQAGIAAHCVHQIRTLLQIGGGESGRRVFAITSPTAGDGKTSLTLSLGLSYAGSGSRTLIVDFDMIGAGLTAALQASTERGLLDAIDQGHMNGHVRPTPYPNLSILPAGPEDADEVSRLSPATVRRIIEQAREQFETIIIDTGPILGSIEAALVCAQVDGVILTVGRGQQRPMAERAVEQLQALGAPLVGVVFNRAEAGDFRRAVSNTSARSVSRQGARPGADEIRKLGPMASTVASQVHG